MAQDLQRPRQKLPWLQQTYKLHNVDVEAAARREDERTAGRNRQKEQLLD